ncbi:MAG: peptidylprolyl isomerase [Pseudonocardiales bacterium]|nr:MAG: peptidylprolyl isomerase [Pseudonocardiales bacterium]
MSASASPLARAGKPQPAAAAVAKSPFAGHVADPVAAPGAVAAADNPCGYIPTVQRFRFHGLPSSKVAMHKQPFSATLVTTQGRITFKALAADAPCTTNSFRFLAQHQYYDDTHCHRLVTSGIFVLQCGDATGTGSGGAGYEFKDENLAGATYPAGTVAMANAGPDTNGSQFFICTKDTTLSPAYTPFGRVTAGMDVLLKIDAGGTDDQNSVDDGYPLLYVGISTVKIQLG